MQQLEDNAILLINKPLRWTSFDVVRKIRGILKIKKVGHAGTLDPLATGLLITATGNKTKTLEQYVKLPKEYVGTFTLGATTPSFDLESQPENEQPYAHLTEDQIRSATQFFMGDIQQLPPIFSAIKQKGKPVYLLARKGENVVLEPRNISIFEFEITTIALRIIHFRVVCSSGTYIRSLANDFGQQLGCGAYLSSLCRTKIGTHDVQNAIDLTQAIV